MNSTNQKQTLEIIQSRFKALENYKGYGFTCPDDSPEVTAAYEAWYNERKALEQVVNDYNMTNPPDLLRMDAGDVIRGLPWREYFLEKPKRNKRA